MIFSTKSIIVVVMALCAIALSSVKAQEPRLSVARRGLKKAKKSKNTKKQKKTKNDKPKPRSATVRVEADFVFSSENSLGLDVDAAKISVELAFVEAAAAIADPSSLFLNAGNTIDTIEVTIISEVCEIVGSLNICGLEVEVKMFMDEFELVDAIDMSTKLRTAFDQGTFDTTVVANAIVTLDPAYQVNVETQNVVTELVTSAPTPAPSSAPTTSQSLK